MVDSLNEQLAPVLDAKNVSLADAYAHNMHADIENTPLRDVTAELLQQAHMVSPENFIY